MKLAIVWCKSLPIPVRVSHCTPGINTSSRRCYESLVVDAAGSSKHATLWLLNGPVLKIFLVESQH